MKKTLLLLAITHLLGFNFLLGQTITGISIFPATPTENDSILILVECMFPSGSCDQHSQDFIIVGNDIEAWALHCTGMLTVICSHTDTFSIGTLNAGTYIFTFQLDQGGLPFPCTPGIVAGPNATMTFTVSTATLFENISVEGNTLMVYPSPVDFELTLSAKMNSEETVFYIYDLSGRRILDLKSHTSETIIDCSSLPNGLYIAEAKNSLGLQRKYFEVQHD